ncbi:MAG: hypothetical protein LBD88_01300 [Candidatus Peribacteria bacterium]|jgi:hypothetical protein|nr:hypothetical protein [Candidatus Peribacteria bacterium]
MIKAHYNVKIYIIDRTIIPGNGEAHFAEVNAFLKTVNEMELAERVEYLTGYLPEIESKINSETNVIQKEKLKILYVL